MTAAIADLEVAPPLEADGRLGNARLFAGALLFYLALAVFFTASVWKDPTNRWIGSCCDQEQTIWNLAWLPTALEQGQNPLLTDRLAAPDGANLMWNTSSPLLALLATPITVTAGPILAYNILTLLGIVASGLACFLALRRYATRPLGPLIAGGVYAISPYVASHTVLHLDLVNAWAPPLFLVLLDELIRGRRRPEIVGVALGLLAAAQLLTFEEVLATSAIAGLILVLLAAIVVRDRAQIGTGVSRLVRAGLPALVTFLVVGGGPLAVQFLGPQQIHGRLQDTSVFSTDLLNLVVPTSYQLIAPAAATAVSSHFSGLFHEATAYIGVPLLLVLAWIVIALRHDRRVIVAAAAAVTMLVLSLGPELHVGGTNLHIPLPWLPLGRLPLLEHAIPGRLTLYMWLAIAVLIALGVDRAVMQAPRRIASLRLVVVAVALVFVLPAPMRSSTTEVPAFFRDWGSQGIADDETILFAPWFANGAGAAPMLWAAVADARPRMYEGYVFVPGPSGRPQYGPSSPQLGPTMSAIQDHGSSIVLRGSARTAALRELADHGIAVVIVGPMRYRDQMVAFFTDLLGQPPTETGGVQLWRDIPGILARLGTAAG